MQKLLFLSIVLLGSCAVISGTFDTTQLTSEYWTAQAYCLGRYQLRIPQNIHEMNSDLFYGQDRIRVSEDETLQSSITLINNARKEGTDYNEIYIFDKILIPNKTHFYVTKYGDHWDMQMIEYFGNPYFVTLFDQLDHWLYVVYSSFNLVSNQDDKLSPIVQQKIKQAENRFQTTYLNHLHRRETNVLPTEPGVCLNGGFLKDNGKISLVGSRGIYFSDFNNNIILTVYMGYPHNRYNIPLLKRDILDSTSEFIRTTDFTDYHIIRQGARNLNNLPGYEILLVLGTGNYYFLWESNNQKVQIELTKKSVSPNLTEQQILEAWDSILPTFKRHH